jgi:hypothetical protein
MARGVEADAGVIVIEDEGACVIVVAPAADARGAGAELTIGQMIGQRRFFRLDRLAVPGSVLPVRGDNDPFLAQRMPSFFPDHKLQFCAVMGIKEGKKWQKETFSHFFLSFPFLLPTPLLIKTNSQKTLRELYR